MTTQKVSKRKPKAPVAPISKYHPMKISCPLCNAEPYLVCTRIDGDGWNDFTLRLWHIERYEAALIEEIFE